MRWGYPGLFDTATPFTMDIKWPAWDLYNTDSLYEIHKRDFYACAIWDTQAFPLKGHCGFNIKPYCSDVYEYHQCPQTLAEICKNMGVCCGFRTVAARGTYPGFRLLLSPILFTAYTHLICLPDTVLLVEIIKATKHLDKMDKDYWMVTQLNSKTCLLKMVTFVYAASSSREFNRQLTLVIS